ncbi:MAG TPA: hypothetical protein VH413_14960 [Verrucomicrobiae bacterium]|jgi:UDP-galactopyranose mutase|nr:hypothetical protein [Verrucomicrobiae bacterium]
MAALHDLQHRHFVVKLAGERQPAMLATPTIKRTPATAAMQKSYLKKIYQKLPFMFRSSDASKMIDERKASLETNLIGKTAEKIAVKRRIS